MILDTSAIVFREPEAEEFLQKIGEAVLVGIGAPTLAEAGICARLAPRRAEPTPALPPGAAGWNRRSAFRRGALAARDRVLASLWKGTSSGRAQLRRLPGLRNGPSGRPAPPLQGRRLSEDRPDGGLILRNRRVVEMEDRPMDLTAQPRPRAFSPT